MDYLLGLPVALLAAILAGRGYRSWIRKRSAPARERAEFKRRLPTWVKVIEFIEFVGCLAVILPTSIILAFELHRSLHQDINPWSASVEATWLIVFSALFLSTPASFLLANLISWLIPSVRKANEVAMEGIPAASFKQLQRGLLVMFAWMAPICLIGLGVGILDPWL